MGLNEIFRNNPEKNNINAFVEQAKKDAISRLPENASFRAREKVKNAIENRFKPCIEENELIARQFSLESYTQYTHDIENFIGTSPAAVVCPDGRILAISIIDPRVSRFHRRLAGLPETRKSTKFQEEYVIKDPYIAASINFTINERKKSGKDPHIVEFIGPHINSHHPDHGCGAAKVKLTDNGRPAVTAMKYGSISEYFQELGDGFYAFQHVAERAGGKATTIDVTHDLYSQGLIFGLKNLYDKTKGNMFDKNKDLRTNLEELHHNREILMTELLGAELKGEIMMQAEQRGISSFLDIRNPYELAKNIMTIGRIAMDITRNHEKSGFSWIPKHLKEGMTQNAVRTLAYHAIRNCVYRILSDIRPGKHDLLEHPEQLISVGPVGPTYNVRTVPFIQVTPDEELRPQDIEGVKKLYTLSEGILTQLGAKLESEGRVIVVTGKHDPSDYANETIAGREFENTISVVRNNAATLRSIFSEGVQKGETIIIGVIFHPVNRNITHVAGS